MAYPTVTVEVAFTTDPTAAPTWTDVSTDVRAIPTIESAHRKDELNRRWEAGSASIVFDNTDGKYDPANTASTYYPNLVPLRRVRIRAVYNAVTYDLFDGFIETWTPQFSYPEESWVEIRAVDGSIVLANTALPGSVYEVEVRADAPVLWWRLGETDGTVAADEAGTYDGSYIGGATAHSTTGLVVNDANKAIDFDGTDDGVTGPRDFPLASAFSVEALFVSDSAAGATAVRTLAFAGQNIKFGSAGVESSFTSDIRGVFLGHEGGIVGTNALTFCIGDGSAVVHVRTTSTAWADNATHHVVATYSAGTCHLVVDGVDQALTTVVAGSPNPALVPGIITVGYAPYSMNGGLAAWNGALDEIAVYASALSVVRAAAHRTAATAPWGTELSGARVTHVLDAIGWRTADRDIDAGTSTLQATSLSGKALAYLEAVASSENGSFYMAPGTGKARFRARHTLFTTARHTTSQKTFSDNPSAGELGYVDAPAKQDLQLIKNRARFKRAGGSAQQVDDAASQQKYFIRGYPDSGEAELLVNSDGEVRDAATWYVTHFKDAQTNYTALVLEPYGDEDNLYPQMLGRLLEDRITVESTPPGGAARSQETLIVGIRHEIPDVNHWRTIFSLSPADTQSYLVLDDATLGQLDGNALAY